MECGRFEKMLPDYLEEALAPEEMARVEKHVASCAKCRIVLDDHRETRLLVKNLKEVEPPPGFTQKIMVQVREEAGEKEGLLKKLFYPLHIKIPIQAIATAVVAVLAIQVYRSVEPQKTVVQLPPASAPIVSAPAAPKEESRPERKEGIVSSPAKKSLRAEEDAQVSRERLSKDKEPKPAQAPSALLKSQTPEEKIPAAPLPEPKKMEATREAERSETFFSPKQAQRETRAAAPSPAAGVASSRMAETINLRIKADDVAVSAQKAAAVLEELGGSKIERVHGEGMEVITAHMQPPRLKDFFERLGSLGETEERPVPAGIAEGFVALRIEIVKK